MKTSKAVVTLVICLLAAGTASATDKKDVGYKNGAGAEGKAHMKRSQNEGQEQQPAENNNKGMCDITKGKCKPGQKPQNKGNQGNEPSSATKENAPASTGK